MQTESVRFKLTMLLIWSFFLGLILLNPVRYGGWYTEMDTITVAASDKLENVVASSGDFVANGNLIFSAGNGFLKLLLSRAEERYTGQGWNSLG